MSKEGAKVIGGLKNSFATADIYIHESAETDLACFRFASVVELTRKIFNDYGGIVYVAPCGAVVRALSTVIKSKKTDPAVVVVDVGGRHAISLLSGHEGGANDLAFAVGNAIFAEPVISATTEAVKNLIVGVGLKRGKDKESIIDSINKALAEAGEKIEHVRMIASVDIKSDEEGLLAAAKTLGAPVRFVSSDEVRNTCYSFEESEFVKRKVGLPAVAEPSALLAGKRTELILAKRKYDGVTVAIAKERIV